MRNDGADPVSYDMVTIVKQRLVFSKRPVPIVGASAVALFSNGDDGNEVAAKIIVSLRLQNHPSELLVD